eukprot:COSAG02_NODE_36570_length_453_cov_0.725989_1_plen_150_part_11
MRASSSSSSSSSKGDFGTRMHDQEKQRQRRIRQKQAEMEEAQRRAAPPVPKIHTKSFMPKHAAISDSAARSAGSRLYMSAVEKNRRVEEARLAKQAAELAAAKAAVPKMNKASRKYLGNTDHSSKKSRDDIWSDLSRRKRKGSKIEADAA